MSLTAKLGFVALVLIIAVALVIWPFARHRK